ncbi:MAG TPA: T9SS type A sorting domain-containing protein, partial [Paludibacter sp.]|nr:T9SS type A sorting domain-containing protein [Paludibacter sp.]
FMKQKKLRVCIMLFLSGFFVVNMHAQNAFTSTGGNLSGSGGSLSYSAGQVFNAPQNGSTGSVTTGVQQPYEISVVTDIKNTAEINLGMSAYPNPAIDNLQLDIEGDSFKGLRYELLDLSGKVLESKKIEGNQTIIAMSQLSHATYFVKVIQNSKEIKTYKIIKK